MQKALLILIINTFLNLDVLAQKLQSEMTLLQTVEVILPNGKTMKNNIVFYIKDGKGKSESGQGGMKINIYYFDSTKTMHTVVDMAGQIQATELTDAINQTNSEFDEVRIDYKAETKEINGISCKKAVILLTEKEDVTEKVVWYDPNITLTFPYNFGVVGLELVKGLPIQYENEQMGMKMIHQIQKVDATTSIPDEVFELPKDK